MSTVTKMFEKIQTEANENVETFAYDKKVSQFMSLMTNNLYLNKEIFLRELISNSNNALNKIHREFLMEPLKLDSEELYIKIIPNKNDCTLTIIDNGIGMTKTDLMNNLGTIAKFETKTFIFEFQAITKISIGQFSMGFHSAYLVADKVTVTSKHNDDRQYLWESSGNGSFTIKYDNSESLARGTKVVLYIKKDQSKYLEESMIKEIIKKHSEFTEYPIKLLVQEELNNIKSIWTRNPNDITENEYDKLYQSLTYDWEKYLTMRHFTMKEGQAKFTAILFVSCHLPLEMSICDRKSFKLYVRRVFIMDNCKELLPNYLNTFITGVVNSENLPINISREMLQRNKIFKIIRQNLIEKCLEIFDGFAKNKDVYKMFYERFYHNIKLGVYEDDINHNKLIQLLRYYTSASGDEMCSLKDYISRMKDNQKYIYFIIGTSKEDVVNNLFVEHIKKRGFEVIYMLDILDEYIFERVEQFDGKQFMSITPENLKLLEDEIEKKKHEENKFAKFENLCKIIKSVLKYEVEKIVISNRSINLPCYIVISQCDWTPSIKDVVDKHILPKSEIASIIAKKQLEINPDHVIIEKLRKMTNYNQNDKYVHDIVNILFGTALLSSGYILKKPKLYVAGIYRMVQLIFKDNVIANNENMEKVD
ncbi:heat shock protein HSP 90-alpha-like [Formica exsecta]|uniref:heat shock protein HSP 90-alpha-like n=1 Tax=Formica exsecta TaxID=72781 RepID=UPI00114316AF|nr:heat shock protein HSP 90-alpha-like [Formica exsecta]